MHITVESDVDLYDYFEDFLDMIRRDPELMANSGWVKENIAAADMADQFEELRREDALVYDRMLEDLRARELI